MYNGGSAEFVVEQGLYYPTAANYGYYSTGFESPGEWDDHQRFFGLDGLDVQYTGAQTETLPYVYYTPSYGYAESPYNPYNPYIPGAVIGVDDPFAGAQQYYTIPPYQTTVSSPAYFPAATHSRADGVSASQDFFPDASASAYNIAFRPSLKHSPPPSAIVYMPPQGPASNPTHSLILPEGPRANAGPSKQIVTHGNLSSGSFRNPASSHVHQGIGASGSGQALDNVSNGRVPSHCNQLKVALPFNRGLSDFSSSAHQQPPADKVQPNLHYGSASGDVNGSMDVLNEQNRGPRTNKSKKLLSVKSCTPNTVDDNTQGNFISADQYNKDDFFISYVDAKFFVIKSYSEDDVHKSVKYNVWSSTPNGNKKLNAAYEDSQRIGAEQSRCCPVFLFFSVNASGQFCGVAEMIGPVDFQKDMNFWQQDKWSGNFPVKWHFIKDVPNTNFRHIVLENNENKPVTNSRDTQEIKYKQGIEMLKIFKTYTLKTSLLDDFLYYENRQKFIQEEKARLLFKSYGNPFFVSPVDPPRQRSAGVNHPPNEDDNFCHQDKPDKPLKPSSPTSTCKEPDNGHVEMTSKGDSGDTPEQNESSPPSGGEEDDVVRVGSVAVKVNGFAKSKNVVTVGTIVLDPGSLVGDKGRVCLEGGKGG